MIAGMMDGLEQKLGKDSRDLEGWKRLIRARRISNEIDKAKISLDLAMKFSRTSPHRWMPCATLQKNWGSIDARMSLSCIARDAGTQRKFGTGLR